MLNGRPTSPRCATASYPASGRRSRSSVGVDFVPRRVGIEARHRVRACGGVGAEVLVVQHAVVADDERRHASLAVLCWPGNHSKSADQPAMGDITERAARRVLALRGEQPVVVPEIARLTTATALCAGDGHGWTERTQFLALLGRPVQPVLLAG